MKITLIISICLIAMGAAVILTIITGTGLVGLPVGIFTGVILRLIKQ
jgi:hypothetical protein